MIQGTDDRESIERFMSEWYRAGFDGLTEEDVEAMYEAWEYGEKARPGSTEKEIRRIG